MANGQNVPGGFGGFLPPEFQQELFAQAEQGRARRQKRSTDQLFDQFTSAGVDPSSGVAQRGAIESVLGPEFERQQGLARDIALQGALFGREERLGEVQFGRQQQLGQQRFGFEKQLQQEAARQSILNLERKFELNKDFTQFQQSFVDSPSFFDTFGQSLASGLGSGIGSAATRRRRPSGGGSTPAGPSS